MRVCSLLPSATEIIYALGASDQLVAVTHECDFPDEARAKPRITRSDISPMLRSLEIDRRVRSQLHDHGTLYHLDVELLGRLSPEIILTQQLCTVCAVSFESVARIASTMPGSPQVISLEPTTLDGILKSIMQVGSLIGREDRAAEVVKGLQQRIDSVSSVTRTTVRRKALCLEWVDPPFCAGHWIPELVEIAGGFDALAKKGKPSHQVAWDEILSYNPEVIVIMCCGFSVERATLEVSTLLEHTHGLLNGIQEGEVYVVDGSSFFSRPGPRIVESIEILATVFHPELFPFDYPVTTVRQINTEGLSLGL